MIKFTDVSFGFPQKDFYNEICFEIVEGDHAALIGSNGTGKSTQLRTVAGLGAAASGGIELCGKPLAALTPLQRASTVSFVTTD